MKFIIGTTNPAKLKAIEEGIAKCNYFDGEKVEIIGEKMNSNVSDMPISLEENMQGAKNRAENLKKKGIEGNFFVGMEGGTTKIGEKAYLFGAIYILDKNGNGHFGLSNFMEVPEKFEKGIYEDGEELGIILGKETKDKNASKKGGAFGAWSDGNLTRTDQFVFAFLSAIPPFFNKFYLK
ncbi:DUF84 family protein [Candidatus Gracilibacteria bacterium]|nr:DUF84 family protein [Candidatus Gracilibacteria bacterium]